MSTPKERVTITVDRTLVRAGRKAVAAGRVDSLSGWVNLALSEKLQRERKLQAMADAIAMYEAEFGVLSEAELAAQARADRRAAAIVRGSGKKGERRKRRAAG